MIMNFFQRMILGILLLLGGCTVGPDYKSPEIKAPHIWHEHNQISPDQPLPTWDQVFDDPILIKLMQDLLNQNFDIRISLARLEHVRSIEKSSFAGLFPTVSGKANAIRARNTKPSRTPSLQKPYNVYNAGFDVSWELDLFGGRRRALEAASADLESQEATHHQLKISTIAELCRLYINLRTQQELLIINQNILQERKTTAGLIQSKYQSGLVNDSEVQNARLQVHDMESKMPDIQGSIKDALYLIHKIMGVEPGTLDFLLEIKPLPKPKMEVLIATPTKILSERPDIQAAERALAAATARQGVAFADILPKINLLGFLGLQHIKSNSVFSSKSESWSLDTGIKIPILDFGKLSADMDAADALQQVAFLTYQQSISNALNDVEKTISTYFESLKSEKSLSKAMETAQDNLSLSQAVYKQGIKSMLEVLTAKEKLYDTQQQHIQSLSQSLINLVTLYKSLAISPQQSVPPDIEK